jgi:predicted enzyme related to lactoylglutathione lyase
MGERTSHDPGTFSWAELSTTDADGAKSFYSELFGWEPDDQPVGDGMTYTMLRLGGREVGALYSMPEAERGQMPAHWNSYVTVADANATAQRAEELGGAVIVPAFDVMDAGRMAVLQDPTGAVLSVWQPGQSIGATVVNDVGAVVWNELGTTDPEAARRFYGELFGWTFDAGASADYSMIRNGERMNGGVRAQTDEERSTGIPPNWLVYFTVTSVDDAVARAEEAGARALVPPMDIAIGRFAVLADPQGAVFAVFEGETEA